ncbi:MAG: hypothetical protein ACQKBY_04200 [Verrucomicrobiales bacterium]
MKKILHLALFPLLLTLAACSGGAGFTGTGPKPTLPGPGGSPNIFDEYRRSGDATMAKGWTRGFDMSGVAFDDKRTATLITRRHVVMAKHYQRKKGAKLVFHDRQGKQITRLLIARENTSADLTVGLLNQPVPAGYRPYALPAPAADHSQLIGRPVIVTDQNRRLFIHLIANISQGKIAFRHDPAETHGWGKNLVVGDSGNPSFLIAGSELVLIETHTFGGPGSGPFLGDPALQTSIKRAVAKLDPAYQIRTRPL